MNLNEIKKNKQYIIKNINTNEIIKRRLYDLGIIKDCQIELLYISPSNKNKAYLVKDAIISIRNKDAKNIEVYND